MTCGETNYVVLRHLNPNLWLMALSLRFAFLPARMMSERGGFNSKFSTWRLAVAYAHVFRLT
jgi:hypothetical protein